MDTIIGIVFFILIIAAGIYFMNRKSRPPVTPDTMDTARIEIIVDPKKKSGGPQNRDDIIRQAEEMGKALISKNPDSPLPYKTMGDFYLGRGFFEEATAKYIQCLSCLSRGVPYEKLKEVERFFEDQGMTREARQLRQFYFPDPEQ